MSEKGSVFQKGGGGTNFEQSVQTAFLTTLIIRGNSPCIPVNEIIEVAFQTTNKGYETDDLFVLAKSAIGQHKILIQIKHNITFSVDNETFKEVIKGFWKDYNNTALFDKATDKLIIVKNGLTLDERNHLKTVLNWAKTHATETDFITEVDRIQVKKNRLDMFRNCLKELNNNVFLTDKELWEFLKCFDVLEYDFLNQSSIDETYFLNLIKLCKNDVSTANEKEIWDAILGYVSKLNKDGGSVTIQSIQEHELYKHFDTKKLNPYFKAVEKLRSDSEIILKPLKNTINDFHIERRESNQLIVDSINDFQFTIVTGKPGVGKSAAVKDILKSNYNSASVFVFRADQFNQPHLAKVFSSQGVNETIQDIFSCLSLIPEKIIVIDSLEKLLEGDPDGSFKQLLSLVKEYPDVKIIGTTRKYAVDLIFQKFGIERNEARNVEINPLDDEELNIISTKFPQIITLLKNDKIKKILQSPKYLDFAILSLKKQAEDYTNISLADFKNKLWNNIVEDITTVKNGLAGKRRKAFLDIALTRAKKMCLFVEPSEKVEDNAIEALEKDEVIFRDKENYHFSPSHDILEDWALIKYVSSVYKEYPKPKELFKNIGNEPAIRRAFRLWIEDYLVDDSSKINELIKETVSDLDIDKYWADELMIAIFKSENCKSFFETFETELLANNGDFFNRCLHLIRTACKESSLLRNNLSLLMPIGSGWRESILFIQKHKLNINNLRLSICNFLFDWEYKLLFQSDQDETETLAVKEITTHFITQIESADEYWQQEFIREKSNKLISLLFNLARISKSEITGLIERSFISKEDRKSWKLDSFYETVIDKCLSGLNNQRLVIELPELVVQTAWKDWKLKIPDKEVTTDPRFESFRSNRLSDDDCWGIRDRHSFSPAGIYKTPIYNLLYYHPFIGLVFLTEFINYSVDFYCKAECEYKHEVSQIEIELNDGSIVKQWAAWELWAAYRGISVTHYLLESLLMSLEKYLLETAEIKTTISSKNLKFMFNYLIRNSNNVAITSVLASVAIAFPEEVDEEMLPLFFVKEFYEWDLNRALHESSTFSPIDNEIYFAQEERWKSNQLPHRKKYTRGIGDFIIDYQFNIRKLNAKIHELFDRLQTKYNTDDVIWKKRLTEIDIRNWEREIDEKSGHIITQPKFDADVSAFMNSNQEYFTEKNTALSYSHLLSKTLEREAQMTFQIWEECFLHYSKKESFDFLYDRPISLAVIGLRDFVDELDVSEKSWCIELLVQSITAILKDTAGRNYGFERSFSLMDKEVALSSFHYLFMHTTKKKDRNGLIYLMLRVLISSFTDPEIDKIVEYFKATIFKSNPTEGKRVWCALVLYAQFKKANPLPYRDAKKLKVAKKQEEKFIRNLSSNNDLNFNINEIDFEKFDGDILTRAFVVTPYYIVDAQFHEFIKHFIPLLTTDLKLEKDYSHHYQEHKVGRQIELNNTLDAKIYIAELLLYADNTLSKEVLDLILDPIYVIGFSMKRSRDELFEFISSVLEFLIWKLDKVIANSKDDDLIKGFIENFWKLWKHLFERIKSSNKPYFESHLFLNIDWGSDSSHWKALENQKEFYHKMVSEIGAKNSKSIINIFSTIGEKTFLPDGISWLVKILKADTDETTSLISPSAERLIKRLFYNHISIIKSNKILIDDFVWILNRMVDLGSSEAYLFRENVITYKTLN